MYKKTNNVLFMCQSRSHKNLFMAGLQNQTPSSFDPLIQLLRNVNKYLTTIRLIYPIIFAFECIKNPSTSCFTHHTFRRGSVCSTPYSTSCIWDESQSRSCLCQTDIIAKLNRSKVSFLLGLDSFSPLGNAYFSKNPKVFQLIPSIKKNFKLNSQMITPLLHEMTQNVLNQ